MTFEEEAIWLSKAVIKLDDNGFIQSFGDQEEEADCEHLRRIALRHARNIQSMFWDQQNEKTGTEHQFDRGGME